MNTIIKIALIQYIMNHDIDKQKGWVQYILMDAAYIAYNDVDYPYKGELSYRFVRFAAGLNKQYKRVRKDRAVQRITFPIGGKRVTKTGVPED